MSKGGSVAFYHKVSIRGHVQVVENQKTKKDVNENAFLDAFFTSVLQL
jgi:hypothetical protein